MKGLPVYDGIFNRVLQESHICFDIIPSWFYIIIFLLYTCRFTILSLVVLRFILAITKVGVA